MSLYVAGINGMVGSHVAELGRSAGLEVIGKSTKELDLTNREAVFGELLNSRPEMLIIAAAKVGGIGANNEFPVEFLSINLQIQTNLMDAAFASGVEKVLFLGSSCVYPKYAAQPISEDSLMTGKLEETNEAYALAKISGIGLINSYRKQHKLSWVSAMPTNLYGPRDNFDLAAAHVIPALIHKFHRAKQNNLPFVLIWGDGTALREFLHVRDLASALMLLLDTYDDSMPINVGSGNEVSIAELASLVADVVGYSGEIQFDASKPNGTPRKSLDNSRIFSLGWHPDIELRNGIAETYEWFVHNQA
jgi:GDP-L-fucose synthase